MSAQPRIAWSGVIAVEGTKDSNGIFYTTGSLQWDVSPESPIHVIYTPPSDDVAKAVTVLGTCEWIEQDGKLIRAGGYWNAYRPEPNTLRMSLKLGSTMSAVPDAPDVKLVVVRATIGGIDYGVSDPGWPECKLDEVTVPPRRAGGHYAPGFSVPPSETPDKALREQLSRDIFFERGGLDTLLERYNVTPKQRPLPTEPGVYSSSDDGDSAVYRLDGSGRWLWAVAAVPPSQLPRDLRRLRIKAES